MRGQQRIVVGWMKAQLERLGWKPERWAREAGLAATTVTRAMSEDYASVSSIPTLDALARAANVPSVLDFLSGYAGMTPPPELVAVLLEELLPTVGCHPDKQQIGALGEAISRALAGMAALPAETARKPDVARIIAQASRHVIIGSKR
jgi:hypothetical protein